jgi:hypothetical protein
MRLPLATRQAHRPSRPSLSQEKISPAAEVLSNLDHLLGRALDGVVWRDVVLAATLVGITCSHHANSRGYPAVDVRVEVRLGGLPSTTMAGYPETHLCPKSALKAALSALDTGGLSHECWLLHLGHPPYHANLCRH